MRYCKNCGNQIVDGRFCVKCGTDNGEVKTEPSVKAQAASAADAVAKMDVPTLLSWGTLIFFAIAAITILVACVKNAGEVCSVSVLSTRTCIPSVIYFVLGMFPFVCALKFLLSADKTSVNSAIGASAVVAVIMLALLILGGLFERSTGLFYVIYCIYRVYRYKISSIIIWCVLSIVAGIIKSRAVNREV